MVSKLLALYLGSVLFVFSQPEPYVEPVKPVEVCDLHCQRVAETKKFYDKYNAPLAVYSDCIVSASEVQGIDYRLIVGISFKESTGGKKMFRKNNAWGWGHKSFASICEGSSVVAKSLKQNYDLSTYETIARKYCPPTWQAYAKSLRKINSEMKEL